MNGMQRKKEEACDVRRKTMQQLDYLEKWEKEQVGNYGGKQRGEEEVKASYIREHNSNSGYSYERESTQLFSYISKRLTGVES